MVNLKSKTKTEGISANTSENVTTSTASLKAAFSESRLANISPPPVKVDFSTEMRKIVLARQIMQLLEPQLIAVGINFSEQTPLANVQGLEELALRLISTFSRKKSDEEKSRQITKFKKQFEIEETQEEQLKVLVEKIQSINMSPGDVAKYNTKYVEFDSKKGPWHIQRENVHGHIHFHWQIGGHGGSIQFLEPQVLEVARNLGEQERHRLGMRIVTPLSDEFHGWAFGDPNSGGSIKLVNDWWNDLTSLEKTKKERGIQSKGGKDVPQMDDELKIKAVSAMHYFRDYFNGKLIYDEPGIHQGEHCTLSAVVPADFSAIFSVEATGGSTPWWPRVSRPKLYLEPS